MNLYLDSIQKTEQSVKGRTAWRLEGVLREFAPMEAKYLWFDYPIHRLEGTDTLKALTAEGESNGYTGKWEKKKRAAKEDGEAKGGDEEGKEKKPESSQMREEILNAMANAKMGEPVTVSDIAEFLGLKYNKVRMRIKRLKEFQINKQTGFVESAAPSDRTK